MGGRGLRFERQRFLERVECGETTVLSWEEWLDGCNARQSIETRGGS